MPSNKGIHKPSKLSSYLKGALLLSVGLYIGHNYSTLVSNPLSATDQALVHQMEAGFTYLDNSTDANEQQLIVEPVFNELSITRKLQKEFDEHVFLKKISNSNLYLAVIDSKSFYVDSTGTYLLNGQLLDIDKKVVVSNIIQAELSNLSSMTNAVTNSVLPSTSSFIESDGVAKSDKVSFVGTNNHKREDLVKNESTVVNTGKINAVASSTQVTGNVRESKQVEISSEVISPPAPYNITTMPISIGEDKPLAPNLVEQAKNLNLFSSQFKSECFNLVMEAESFVEMYHMFNAMPLAESKGNDVKRACGILMAGKHISVIPDESLVVYEAPNSKRSITIVSDYTCPYCKKAHNEIPKYLENGVTVRVFPYGRYSYRAEDGSGTIFSQNMDILTCQNAEGRVRAMDELTDNPRKFSTTLLQGYAPVTDECRKQTYIYKVLGDVLVRKETPLIISDKGDVASGYFPYGTLLSRWDML